MVLAEEWAAVATEEAEVAVAAEEVVEMLLFFGFVPFVIENEKERD